MSLRPQAKPVASGPRVPDFQRHALAGVEKQVPPVGQAQEVPGAAGGEDRAQAKGIQVLDCMA